MTDPLQTLTEGFAALDARITEAQARIAHRPSVRVLERTRRPRPPAVALLPHTAPEQAPVPRSAWQRAQERMTS